MKAIAIEGYGSSEELRRRGLPRPEPASGEVLIRVVVAGVSSLDCAVRRGDAGDVTCPWVPGFEVAGVIEQLGPGCGRFRVGERVFAGLPMGGGYAQFVATHESLVAPMPASLLFEEAATLPLDGLAAYRALHDGNPAIDGASTVAVAGAGSGAGHLAIQIALAAGARVWAHALAGQREFVDRLGRVEWLEATDGVAADVRIDAANGPALQGWTDLGGGPGSHQAAVLGGGGTFDGLARLAPLVEQRRLRPRLFKILNIGKAIEAHQAVESEATCGKLALSI